MSVLSRLRPALLLAAIAAAAPAALAAEPDPPPATPATAAAPSEIGDRLFLAFAQDPALVQSQWWEAQVEYADGGDDVPVNALLVRAVVAFRPWKSLEVGGRVGFGRTHAPGAGPDGTGATDLDVYGKWVFVGLASNTDFTAGLLFTVPTGDDTAALGYNSFATQVFGGVSHRLDSVEIGGHVGVRLNGNGRVQGVPLAGKTSFEVGLSALFPLANEVSIVGEAQFESDRFEESDALAEILAGINWRAFNRGVLRGAVSAGLTDGSPTFRVLVGYAYTF